MSKKKKKSPILLTVVVLIAGILLGFLGELMPDDFKEKVTPLSQGYLGLSYPLSWTIVVFILVAISIILVWKQESQNQEENITETARSIGKEIKQGQKSVYIEKNKGDIKIR